MNIDKDKLRIGFWYEDMDGNRLDIDEDVVNYPASAVTTHTFYPLYLTERISSIHSDEEKAKCRHARTFLEKYPEPMKGFKGRMCKLCGCTQKKKWWQPWGKKWDVGLRTTHIADVNTHVGRENEATILAMANSGDYTLSEAMAVYAHACERCSNVLSYHYTNGQKGYEEFSEQWRKANTSCDFCKNDDETADRLNKGSNNAGHHNTGNLNAGNYNTGHCNAGNWNTGDHNTGDWNRGNCNTGHCNAGNENTGSWNTGNFNTGKYNSGDFNTTDHSAGCFNTEKQKIIMFDRPSDWTYKDWLSSDARDLLYQMPKGIIEWVDSKDMTDEEKAEHPAYETIGGYLRKNSAFECMAKRQKWWDGLDEKEKEIIKSLPNFNPDIFEKCTEIQVKD